MPPPIPFIEDPFEYYSPSMCKHSKCFLSLRPPHKNPACTSSVAHTCHIPWLSHSSLYITRVIFGDAYKSWSSSLCILLHLLVILSLLGPHIFLSTLFSNNLNLWETKVYPPTKQQTNLPNWNAKYCIAKIQVLSFIHIGPICVCTYRAYMCMHI